MATIFEHIRSLESYVEQSGARLVRAALAGPVHGEFHRDLIVLRQGLDPQQELLALVHEITHWLAHDGARSHPLCTLFEYEAEAVESLVMTRLGLPAPQEADPTDDLLPASVTRVRFASRRICDALGV